MTAAALAHDPGILNGWLRDLLPDAPAVVMDVGTGSGRDAAWLSSLNHEVLAIEPSAAMRTEAQRLHPTANLRWLEDKLPDLTSTIWAAPSADRQAAPACPPHRGNDGSRRTRQNAPCWTGRL
jgi:SAM-dependent methyltransferase